MLLARFTYGQKPDETYPFSEDIHAGIEKDTVSWKYQTGAVRYSFIGDYKNTLAVWDKGVPARIYTPTPADSAILKNSAIQNARDHIISRSENEQIIIINEAHHNPKHRTFTSSLLEGLYKNGYRYLGLEALWDTTTNERKYAVKESGFYIAEPEFGNLIYEAGRIGFKLFGYEASEDKNGKEREIEQAQNIQAFMKANPDGKYIIHCGFNHVYENHVQGWEKAMAGRVKEYTGIDPFTIDQVRFTERSKPEFGHYFLYATKEQEPFVLIDRQNQAFNGISEPRQTDLVVIHPLTRYKNERPGWLGKREYRLPGDKLKSYPVQVLAYRINEYEHGGIPADIIEIRSAKENKPLLLQNGEYKLVIRNRLYDIPDTFEISIK